LTESSTWLKVIKEVKKGLGQADKSWFWTVFYGGGNKLFRFFLRKARHDSNIARSRVSSSYLFFVKQLGALIICGIFD